MDTAEKTKRKKVTALATKRVARVVRTMQLEGQEVDPETTKQHIEDEAQYLLEQPELL